MPIQSNLYIILKGKWAESAELYKAGDKFRFKYTFSTEYTGDEKKISPSDSEIAGYPIS